MEDDVKKSKGAEEDDVKLEKKKKKLHEINVAFLLSMQRDPNPVDIIQMLTMGTLGGAALRHQSL